MVDQNRRKPGTCGAFDRVDIGTPEGASAALAQIVDDIDTIIGGLRTLAASVGEVRRRCKLNTPVQSDLLYLPIQAASLLASESVGVAVNVVGLLSALLARMTPLPDGPKPAA